MATNYKKFRYATKLHVRTGDKVQVLSGDDKGKTGVITRVFPEKQRAIVEGVNMVKKHIKATQEDAGGVQEMEAAIHISNLAVLDPKTGEPTRVGRRIEDGRSVRYSKKTGNTIA
jgi:large subunit ribosomal protein L24